MVHVEIYTDGAARGNPNGPGGYGVILRYTDQKNKVHEKELSEGFNPTSNNRMEVLAAIVALESLKTPCRVDLYSDSSYLVNAMTKGWLQSWQKNGWRTAGEKPVKNKDLWLRLSSAMKPHHVTFHWVKGHNGHPENERCDYLATSAADAAERKKKPFTDPNIQG